MGHLWGPTLLPYTAVWPQSTPCSATLASPRGCGCRMQPLPSLSSPCTQPRCAQAVLPSPVGSCNLGKGQGSKGVEAVLGCPRCSPNSVAAKACASSAEQPCPQQQGPGSGSQRRAAIISLVASGTINNCSDAFESRSVCEASAALPGGTSCAVASLHPSTMLAVPGRAEPTASAALGPGQNHLPSPHTPRDLPCQCSHRPAMHTGRAASVG